MQKKEVTRQNGYVSNRMEINATKRKWTHLRNTTDMDATKQKWMQQNGNLRSKTDMDATKSECTQQNGNVRNKTKMDGRKRPNREIGKPRMGKAHKRGNFSCRAKNVSIEGIT